MKTISPLATAVFATDPRVLARARLKFEVNPDDHEKLVAAVERLQESAETGQEPEAIWLAEAKDLGERVGQHWRDVPASIVIELLKTASPLVPLGLPQTFIRCCETISIETTVNEIYKPVRLVIDSAVASWVSVSAIIAGREHCIANRAPLPGTLFSPDAFPFRLHMKTLCKGDTLLIDVVNHSACDVNVGMCVLGLTYESISGPPQKFIHPWESG